MAHLPTTAAPKITLTSYSITIPIFRSNPAEEGVLIAHGNFSSGYALYIKDNALFYEYNSVGTIYKIQSSVPVPIGASTIRFEFKKVIFTQGIGKLSINDQQVGTLYMPRTLPFVLSVEGLDIGKDGLTPVSTNYPVPEFPFSGQIEKVIIELYDDQQNILFFEKKKRDSICIILNGTILYL